MEQKFEKETPIKISQQKPINRRFLEFSILAYVSDNPDILPVVTARRPGLTVGTQNIEFEIYKNSKGKDRASGIPLDIQPKKITSLYLTSSNPEFNVHKLLSSERYREDIREMISNYYRENNLQSQVDRLSHRRETTLDTKKKTISTNPKPEKKQVNPVGSLNNEKTTLGAQKKTISTNPKPEKKQANPVGSLNNEKTTLGAQKEIISTEPKPEKKQEGFVDQLSNEKTTLGAQEEITSTEPKPEKKQESSADQLSDGKTILDAQEEITPTDSVLEGQVDSVKKPEPFKAQDFIDLLRSGKYYQALKLSTVISNYYYNLPLKDTTKDREPIGADGLLDLATYELCNTDINENDIKTLEFMVEYLTYHASNNNNLAYTLAAVTNVHAPAKQALALKNESSKTLERQARFNVIKETELKYFEDIKPFMKDSEFSKLMDELFKPQNQAELELPLQQDNKKNEMVSPAIESEQNPPVLQIDKQENTLNLGETHAKQDVIEAHVRRMDKPTLDNFIADIKLLEKLEKEGEITPFEANCPIIDHALMLQQRTEELDERLEKRAAATRIVSPKPQKPSKDKGLILEVEEDLLATRENTDNDEGLVATGENSDNGFGYYETQGKRPEQQDALAWQKLAKNALEGLSPKQIGKCLAQAYKILDQNISKNIGIGSGTTASTVVWDGKRNLITATLADTVSFAVVYGENGAVLGVKRLNSVIHKPSNKDEKVRITKAGGFVDKKGRVLSRIAVSRAIGDHDYATEKGVKLISSDAHIDMINISQLMQQLAISTKAYVSKIHIISACDGFTEPLDKMGKSSDIDHANFLKAALEEIPLKERGGAEKNIAQRLAAIAPEKGSGDNISVAVQSIAINSPILMGVYDGHGESNAVSAYVAENVIPVFLNQCNLLKEKLEQRRVLEEQRTKIFNKVKIATPITLGIIGAAIGAGVGSLIFPGVGTAIGAVLGGAIVGGGGASLGLTVVGLAELFKKNPARGTALTIAGSIGVGAAVGALLGTFVFPGIGTGIGAAIGAGVGAAIGCTGTGIYNAVTKRPLTGTGLLGIGTAGIGAGIGAAIGTAFFPGPGTAIGAAIGAAIPLAAASIAVGVQLFRSWRNNRKADEPPVISPTNDQVHENPIGNQDDQHEHDATNTLIVETSVSTNPIPIQTNRESSSKLVEKLGVTYSGNHTTSTMGQKAAEAEKIGGSAPTPSTMQSRTSGLNFFLPRSEPLPILDNPLTSSQSDDYTVIPEYVSSSDSEQEDDSLNSNYSTSHGNSV